MITENQIIQLEENLRVAMLNGDTAQLQAVLAEDLQFISHSGKLVSKNEDIAAHASRRLKILRLDFSDRRITLFPHGGIVTVLAAISGNYDGHPFTGNFRYMRVWIYENGLWQVHAAQATELNN